MLKKIATLFKRRGPTHILFCVPRHEGSMLPLPQFLALPMEDGGEIFAAEPDILVGKLNARAFTWFRNNNQTPALTFFGFSNTPKQFFNHFGTSLEKHYRDYSFTEEVDLGDGHWGFCLGKANLSLKGDTPLFSPLTPPLKKGLKRNEIYQLNKTQPIRHNQAHTKKLRAVRDPNGEHSPRKNRESVQART